MRESFLVAIIASATVFAQTKPIQEKKTVMHTATGTFDVKMLPPSGPADANGFLRFSIDKTFQGPLEGTSRVEMMADGDGSSPSGGYVALEKFEGKLDGRAGAFVMLHLGTMSPGKMSITVVISPGSGTGELREISGTLEIRKEGKQHYYTLRYVLGG